MPEAFLPTRLEVIDPRRHLEIGFRQPPGGVVRERQADPVPAVDEDVGVVVGLLGGLGYPVDKRHRLDEVVEFPFADNLPVLELPLAFAQAVRDLAVAEQLCHIVLLVRIVSLVPSATEMLFALGLGSDLIAVTHECDFPPVVEELPKVTRDVLPPGLSAAEIDAAVKERTLNGESIYELDVEQLHDLRPDLIVTQALCSVCAVSYDDVRTIAEELETQPMVISLDPHTVGEVLGDARTLAEATDRRDAAVDLVRAAAERIDRVRLAVRRAKRPRVVALEWLDPPFAAGHWTPQLIEFAGGVDVLGFAGENSAQRTWAEVRASQPDIVIVMPCGYDAEIAHREAEMHRDELRAIGAGEVVAVDAAAYFSRPGPRIVDGLALLAHIIHPELVPEAPGEALTVEL
jgi:iron complex transport system substrate-binding protein